MSIAMSEGEYQKTLAALDQTEVIHWHSVMNGAKPLFDRLLLELSATPCLLTVRQQANALMVLFRLRAWGGPRCLTPILKAASESGAPEVREQAAKLSAGLVRLSRDESHKSEVFDTKPLTDLLRASLGRGVSKNTADLIRSILPDEPDSPSS